MPERRFAPMTMMGLRMAEDGDRYMDEIDQRQFLYPGLGIPPAGAFLAIIWAWVAIGAKKVTDSYVLACMLWRVAYACAALGVAYLTSSAEVLWFAKAAAFVAVGGFIMHVEGIVTGGIARTCLGLLGIKQGDGS